MSLTQAEKEDLWHADQYSKIVEADIGVIVSTVNRYKETHQLSNDDVSDLINDTVLRLLKVMPTYVSMRGKFTTFIIWQVRACVTKMMRKRTMLNQAVQIQKALLASDEEANEAAMYADKITLREAMSELSELDQECVLAHNSKGNDKSKAQSSAMYEVAEKYGMSHQAVRYRAVAAQRRLRLAIAWN